MTASTLGTMRYLISNYIILGKLRNTEKMRFSSRAVFSCYRGNKLKTKHCCLKMTLWNLGFGSVVQTVNVRMSIQILSTHVNTSW